MVGSGALWRALRAYALVTALFEIVPWYKNSVSHDKLSDKRNFAFALVGLMTMRATYCMSKPQEERDGRPCFEVCAMSALLHLYEVYHFYLERKYSKSATPNAVIQMFIYVQAVAYTLAALL